jgi:hypothetical protein
MTQRFININRPPNRAVAIPPDRPWIRLCQPPYHYDYKKEEWFDNNAKGCWSLTLYPHHEAIEYFEQFKDAEHGQTYLTCMISEDKRWLLVRSPLPGRKFSVRKYQNRRPHLIIPLKAEGEVIPVHVAPLTLNWSTPRTLTSFDEISNSGHRPAICKRDPVFSEEHQGWMFEIIFEGITLGSRVVEFPRRSS